MAEEAVPPFVAEAKITRKVVRHGQTTPYWETEGNAVFSYSNGWWQAELNYKNPKEHSPAAEYFRKVPGGVSSYIMFTSKSKTEAVVCPLAFPTAGNTELFAFWLSICPKPELPLIDGKRIRRFPLIPNCRDSLDIFNHPQNEGYYTASYLKPGSAFLSNLNITNNGVTLDIEVAANGEVETKIIRHGAPFDKGFNELSYQLLETTNLNGIVFPARAVLKLMTPNWKGKDREDLHVAQVVELTVTRISTLPEGGAPTQSSAPGQTNAIPEEQKNKALSPQIKK
ncbi:hypothetical protein [Pedosphaera parvula]|nr:hypothetical protein [Pedosphaera parvula]